MILTWDFEGNETIKGKDIVFLPTPMPCGHNKA